MCGCRHFISSHDRPYVVQKSATEELRHSFFPRTVIDWNKLENAVVHADSVGSFRTLVSKTSSCSCCCLVNLLIQVSDVGSGVMSSALFNSWSLRSAS